MSGHTPGPWTTSDVKHGGINHQLIQIHSETEMLTVAYVLGATNPMMDHFCPAQRMPANARLIAAAPELLEALLLAKERARGFIDDFGPDTDSLPEIDAAIAKATGSGP